MSSCYLEVADRSIDSLRTLALPRASKKKEE